MGTTPCGLDMFAITGVRRAPGGGRLARARGLLSAEDQCGFAVDE